MTHAFNHAFHRSLAGATASQPGIKIKFTGDGANLLGHFPDQFEPFAMFGCDLQTYFNGTFFRFPLRPKHLAKDSEISNVSYGDEAVGEL